MLTLNETNFDQHVTQGTFVVDFSAEWCPPCRLLKPILQRVADSMAAEAAFAEVDADENSRLLQRFNVQALPTVIVFRDGQPVHVMRGLRNEQSLVAEVRKAITHG